ncbi:DUF4049 domain-containing protein [Escherichia coli]
MIGPITVSSDEITNALEPVDERQLSIKSTTLVLNGKKFKNSRAISCRSFNCYFSVSTDHRCSRDHQHSSTNVRYKSSCCT